MAQCHRRVVGVTGDAPHTANALDAATQRRTFRGALRRPCAVEGDKFQRIRRKIHGKGSRLVQCQGLGARIGVHGGAGDEILRLVHAVPQLHYQPACVLQKDR